MSQQRDPTEEALQAAGRRARGARRELERREPLWPAETTLLVAIALGLLLPDQLTIGNRWIMPALEATVLAGLLVTSPRPPTRETERRRLVRIGLVGLVSAVNVVALFLLAELLVQGETTDGRALLLGGGVLWITAILLFAVWFWELDRGGPVRRLTLSDEDQRVDFRFPEMTEDVVQAPREWRPRLIDYVYLSVNNAASFSPTETYPITVRAKVLLMAQTLASLVTTTLVIAYAINNLSGGGGGGGGG